MGSRSFDLVDFKVAEADFFLEKLRRVRGDFFPAKCYFSAFAAAARSVTYSLQAVLADCPGFDAWYAHHQKLLKDDEVARFFHLVRRIGHHVGECPIRRVSGGPKRKWLYHFAESEDFPDVPKTDVASACRHYLTLLVGIVLDCYHAFGEVIDPEQHYTKEAFQRRGKTLDDAYRELYGVYLGWSDNPPMSLAYRVAAEDYQWQMLRDSMPGCQIDYLFQRYLKLNARGQSECLRLLPTPAPPEGWTRKDGWILPPGFDDIDAYLDALKSGNAPRNW